MNAYVVILENGYGAEIERRVVRGGSLRGALLIAASELGDHLDEAVGLTIDLHGTYEAPTSCPGCGRDLVETAALEGAARASGGRSEAPGGSLAPDCCQHSRRFGLGSAVVGPLSEGSRCYCERCSRCGGAGRKPPALIAGRLVGGDEPPLLCFACRGTGARTYIALCQPKALA